MSTTGDGPPSFPPVKGNSSFYSDAADDDAAAKCPSISEIRTGVESTYNIDHHHEEDLTNKKSPPSMSEIHGGLNSSISNNQHSVNGDKYLLPPSRDQMREAVHSQTNSHPQEEANPPPGLSDAADRWGESDTKKEQRRRRQKFTSSRYKGEDDDDDDDLN